MRSPLLSGLAVIGPDPYPEIPGGVGALDMGFRYRKTGFIPWEASSYALEAHRGGLALLGEGRYEEAAHHFYELTVKKPENVLSHYGYVLATLHRSLAVQRDALMRYRRRVEAGGPLERIHRLAFADLFVGFERQGGTLSPSVGRRVLAVRALEHMRSDDDVAVALWAARVFFLEHREDLRRDVLRKWLATHPGDYLVRHELATAYEEGMEIKSYPSHLPPEELAELMREAEGSKMRYDLTLKEADRVLKQAPDFAIAYWTAALGEFFAGDKARAKRRFQQYLERAPQGAMGDRARDYLKRIGTSGRSALGVG